MKNTSTHDLIRTCERVFDSPVARKLTPFISADSTAAHLLAPRACDVLLRKDLENEPRAVEPVTTEIRFPGICSGKAHFRLLASLWVSSLPSTHEQSHLVSRSRHFANLDGRTAST
jgi:hypothetical protein